MNTNTAQLLAEIPLFSTMDDEEYKGVFSPSSTSRGNRSLPNNWF
ncbi:MAG TPA: hypothetical protein VNW73_04550 [Ktedonobacteraceae bacterium]|jgi:hypothetical protein|nr:hypothetical protein [Ktedonobacteraceae bacterium]